MLRYWSKDGKELSMVTERENIKMLERVEELNRMLEGREFKIFAANNFKNNGSKVGYALTSELGDAAPVVYYENISEYWESNEDIIKYLESVFERHKIGHINIEKCCTREYILSHVRPRLVSAENLPMVQEQGVIYQEFLDMLILYYIEIDEVSDDEGFASATLKHAMLKQAGIILQELEEFATKNLRDDYQIISLENLIFKFMGEDWEDEETEEGMPMWVITNKRQMQGAATILSTEILADISKKFDNETFVVIPSSVHECIAVPAEQINLEELRKTIYEVNRTQLEIDDILTDSVYLYEDGEVTIY